MKQRREREEFERMGLHKQGKDYSMMSTEDEESSDYEIEDRDMYPKLKKREHKEDDETRRT